MPCKENIFTILAGLFLCLLPAFQEVHGGEFSSAYGIHLYSFQDETLARERVEHLKELGCDAFYLPVFIPGKGQWFRVFAGGGHDEAEVARKAESLIRRGIIEEYSLVKTEGLPEEKRIKEPPAAFAVHVASFKDARFAAERVGELSERGLSAFSVVHVDPKGTEWHRVFAGMYENREKALEEAERLRSGGVVESYWIVKLDAVPGKRDLEAPMVREGKAEDVSETEKVESLAADRSFEEPETGEVSRASDLQPGSQVERGTGTDETPPSRKLEEQDLMPSVELSQEEENEDLPGVRPDSREERWKTMEERYPVLRDAMAFFRMENYAAAQEKFHGILKDNTIDERLREFVIRRSADCDYELALRAGDRPRLAASLDSYRDILRRYPGEDDHVLLHMGEGYQALGLYQESLRELGRLIENHPRSPYVARARYLRGKAYHGLHRYDMAVEELEEYMGLNVDGSLDRAALLILAESYSHEERYKEADETFEKLVQLWSGLEAMPPGNLLALGSHYLRSGELEKGLEVFLVWFNLYPDSPEAAEVLHGSGRILASMGQVSASLALLRLVVERFPESRQARESKIIMADLGLRYPGRSLPQYIFDGMIYYLDPIRAYDDVLAVTTERDKRDELIFMKTEALMQLRRYKEAFETAGLLQSLSPWGPYRRENRQNLLEIAAYLINDHYVEGDYLAAADVFIKVHRQGFAGSSDDETLLRAGKSLAMLGLWETAAQVFEDLAARRGRTRVVALAELARIDMERGEYGNAWSRAEKALEAAEEENTSPAPQAFEILATLAFREQDYESAAFYYAEAAKGFPPSAERVEAMVKEGRSLRAMGNHEKALVRYREALESARKTGIPEDDSLILSALEGIAECHHLTGRYEESIPLYLGILEGGKDGSDALWILYRLGQAYAYCGKFEESIKMADAMNSRAGDSFWRGVAEYGRDYWSFYARYGDIAATLR